MIIIHLIIMMIIIHLVMNHDDHYPLIRFENEPRPDWVRCLCCFPVVPGCFGSMTGAAKMMIMMMVVVVVVIMTLLTLCTWWMVRVLLDGCCSLPRLRLIWWTLPWWLLSSSSSSWSSSLWSSSPGCPAEPCRQYQPRWASLLKKLSQRGIRISWLFANPNKLKAKGGETKNSKKESLVFLFCKKAVFCGTHHHQWPTLSRASGRSQIRLFPGDFSALGAFWTFFRFRAFRAPFRVGWGLPSVSLHLCWCILC